MNNKNAFNSCSPWHRVQGISIIPQNAVEVEEVSTAIPNGDQMIRVYISFESTEVEQYSLKEQIERTSSQLSSERGLKVRRMDESGYAITAEISYSDLKVIERLSNVAGITILEEAEIKKKEETFEERQSSELETDTVTVEYSEVQENSVEAMEVDLSSVQEEESQSVSRGDYDEVQSMTVQVEGNMDTATGMMTGFIFIFLIMVIGVISLFIRRKKKNS